MFKILNYLGVIKVLNWLKPTVEGNDGKASARRLTLLSINILFILGNIQAFYVINNTSLIYDVLVLDAIFILVLFGIVSIDNIITLIKMKNGG